jgi:hypothetical protein
MAGASFLTDNADLQFYLGPGIDWERVASLTERGYRDPDGFKNASEARAFYRDVVGMTAEFAAREVAPFAAELDRQSCRRASRPSSTSSVSWACTA